MIVDLIAYTTLVPEAIAAMGYKFHPGYGDQAVTEGDELVEVAGRECYQSWGRPNPGTAHNTGYLSNILNKRHYSVLEHVSLTFSIRNVSRALTHELVRHRHLSPSMLSQRFVDESRSDMVLPPEVLQNEFDDLSLLILDAHEEALSLYEKISTRLMDAGVPRKRARQAARYVLPNGHETRLIVTGNVRAWREFVSKRIAKDPLTEEPLADLEIYELAAKILAWLREKVPNSVQDM